MSEFYPASDTKIRSQRILNGKVNFPFCLAPMVGLTHAALRMAMREYLPANAFTVWPTEMLNSRYIPFENLNEIPEAVKGYNENGIVPQILGNEEKNISESVKRLVDWGAEGIDINMGCPVQKALKHNYGVALMGDSNYAAQVVEMTKRNSAVPVSVKLRSGQQGDMDFLKNFVRGLRSAGADWVTLHPRTPEQKRRGAADWNQIKELVSADIMPVIGNGDIQTSSDVQDMIQQTGCEMVMAGRALAARPWMLWQLGEDWGFQPPVGKEDLRAPRTGLQEGAEYGRFLFRFIFFLRSFFKEDQALRRLRFFVRTTSVWLVFGHTLNSIVTKNKTLDEIEIALKVFFESDQEMVQRTELRQ